MNLINRPLLRSKLRHLRQNLPQDQQTAAAQAVCHHVLKLAVYQHALHAAFYLARDAELDPAPILQHAWQANKICYLPILQQQQLAFGVYTANTNMRCNQYHIPEPMTAKLTQPNELDCVFVPLVGFDRQGNRLGMGGGFYDRSFSKRLQKNQHTPTLIGLAYSMQEIDSLTRESWDVPLDYVITEKEIIDCQ